MATTIPSSVMGRSHIVPSERINVAIIGLGSRGFNLLAELLKRPATQVVGLCDVAELHYRDRIWGKATAFGREPARRRVEKAYANQKSGTPAQGIKVTSDFRELTGMKEVDAVVVATPDHWHALCALSAISAGKDVYCEKPVTHTFIEGQRLHQAVRQNNTVFQTGSQQRSDRLFRRAAELARNGHLGTVTGIEVGLPPGYDKPQDDATPKDPPKLIDYDMWTGPAALLPYMRARHHRWWRGHRAYGGGVLMDWIGHHNDIAHWAMNADRSGPIRIEAVDWRYPATEIYNSPQQYEIRCEYANGVTSTIGSSYKIGTKIVGDSGWVDVDRGRLTCSTDEWAQPGFDPGKIKVYRSDNHVDNFLQCVKTRDECVAPAEIAHRSITPGHLAYVSHQLQRPIKWNAEMEKAVDDDDANKLLRANPYRSPWSL